ncbi:1-phosphofructokinase family hexose kinase [Actinocorallia populi]|uniref:1-phosphofructokinase family hexose kinase n=1 Tax=Actinocorallia populi TaxID=2079200 RepID=UPI000D08DFA9|nr:PfkB family carbohydrate kinase [Actinocorallia populi]
MILTVTLNLALDVTYDVETLTRHATHRVQRVRQRAGGKGVNVARVLASLGQETLATGLCGGPTGDFVRGDLDEAGVPHAFHTISGDTRRAVTVVDDDATVFNEPGPLVSAAEWSLFQAHFARLVKSAHVVVLSGSLPPGLPDDAYATLIRLAKGAKVLVDTSGPALSHAAAASPDLIKPNALEFAEAGLSPAGPLVVSRGGEGMLAMADGRCWEARPPEVLSGNPTGAGDAAAAALAVALRDGAPWEEALRDAVALSAAAVLAPVAGAVDPAAYRRFLPKVSVKEVPCPW